MIRELNIAVRPKKTARKPFSIHSNYFGGDAIYIRVFEWFGRECETMAAPCTTRTIAWSSPVLSPQPTTGSVAGGPEATPAAAPVPAGVFLAVFGASWRSWKWEGILKCDVIGLAVLWCLQHLSFLDTIKTTTASNIKHRIHVVCLHNWWSIWWRNASSCQCHCQVTSQWLLLLWASVPLPLPPVWNMQLSGRFHAVWIKSC